MTAVEKVTEVPKLLKDATNRQYLPDGQLGSGGFATCFRASMIDRRTPPESAYCALKAVKAAVPKNLVQRFRLELAIQSKLRHPHVVELFRAFTFQDITYVALELCPNGSLTDMMKRRKYLTMGEIRRMLIQLCGAVKYLHDRDIVHRDIKAGNIFLDENMNVKLGDFGLAAIMEPSPKSVGADASTLQHIRRTTFCGTPNYLAPEILSRGEGHGTGVDIWAIGVLAYYLAVGRAPFHSKSKDEIYARLKKGEYSWPELAPEQNEIPDDLRDLVGMLLVEEIKRPSTDVIVDHPFLKDGFIPNKLEALCRTRRPRWARIGDEGQPGQSPPQPLSRQDGDQRRIYDDLCIASRVGEPWVAKSAILPAEKPEPSMFLVLAKEVSQKVKLEIPLKEGLVYTGRPSTTVSSSTATSTARKRTGTVRSTKFKTQPVQILEDTPPVEMERRAAEEIKLSSQLSAQQAMQHQKRQHALQAARQQAESGQTQRNQHMAYPQPAQGAQEQQMDLQIPPLRPQHVRRQRPLPAQPEGSTTQQQAVTRQRSPPLLPEEQLVQSQHGRRHVSTKAVPQNEPVQSQPLRRHRSPQVEHETQPLERPQSSSRQPTPPLQQPPTRPQTAEAPVPSAESTEEPHVQEQLKRPPRRTRTVTKAQTISNQPQLQKTLALRSTAGTGNRVRARVAEFEGRGKVIDI